MKSKYPLQNTNDAKPNTNTNVKHVVPTTLIGTNTLLKNTKIHIRTTMNKITNTRTKYFIDTFTQSTPSTIIPCTYTVKLYVSCKTSR